MKRKRVNRCSSAASLRSDAMLLIGQSEEQRAGFARAIHDDLAQKLTVLGIEVALWKEEAGASVIPAAALEEKISIISELLSGAMAGARMVSSSLWPRTLESFGLPAAIESMLARLRAQTSAEIRFTSEPDPSNVPTGSAIHLVRILESVLAVGLPPAVRCLSVILRQQQDVLRLRLSADAPFAALPEPAAARLRIFGGKSSRRGNVLMIDFPTGIAGK